MPESQAKINFDYEYELNASQCGKELDYYAILDVPRFATATQIALAYRKRAIHCHPNRNRVSTDGIAVDCRATPFPSIPLCTQWFYINRAYDVLANPLRREIYDRHGSYGLERGVALPNDYFHPYNYHDDCFKTFNEVFGSDSPYADIVDAICQPPLLYTDATFEVGVKTKESPIEKNIYLNLEEIFQGTVKRMKILRYEACNEQHSKIEKRERALIVPIAPGTLTGTRITFKEEGYKFPTKISADIVFIAMDKPHDTFERRGSDLHMTCDIGLKQALCGFRFAVQTIDCRKLKCLISDVIHPGYVKEIVGEGLPKPGEIEAKQRGNLFIHFNVVFPNTLTRDMKSKLSRVFDELRVESEMK